MTIPPAVRVTNDDVPTLTIDDVAAQDEGTGTDTNFVFTVHSDLTIADNAAVSFEIGADNIGGAGFTDSADFSTATASGTISSGDSSTATLVVTGDSMVEADETFTVAFTSASVTDSAVTPVIDDTAGSTITNDDHPTLTIDDVTVVEGNSGTTAVVFEVATDKEIAPNITFDFELSITSHLSTDSSDFSIETAAGSLVGVSAGSAVNVELVVNGDTVVEPDETYQVGITDINVGTAAITAEYSDTATGTIENDDNYQVAVNLGSITNSLQEGTDYAGSFTVSIDQDPYAGVLPAHTVTVTWHTEDISASAGSDYTAMNGSVTFPDDGNAATPFTVDLTGLTTSSQDDSYDEGDESFQLVFEVTDNSTISPALSTTGNDTITILDDDYTVTFAYSTGGTITPPATGDPLPVLGSGQVELDSSQAHVFSLSADHGLYTFEVTPGGNPTGSLSPAITDGVTDYTYTFDAIDTTGLTDKTMSAVFLHKIDVSAHDDGGELQLSTTSGSSPTTTFRDTDESILVNSGSNNEFLVSLDSGYCVQDFVVDGLSLGLYTNNYSFSPILDDHSVAVTISERPAVTVNLLPAGYSYDDPIGVWDAATWEIYEATSSGAVLNKLPGSSVYISGESVEIPCGIYYFKIVFADITGWATPEPQFFSLSKDNYDDITASGTYTPLQVRLSLVTSGSGNGEISVDPLGTGEAGSSYYVYNVGDEVELSALPDTDTNSLFYSWAQDLEDYGSTSVVTITMDKDKIAEARFLLPCTDSDGDGFIAEPASGETCVDPEPYDCNDTNKNIYPGADEACGDGVNSNCSWVVDPNDPNGFVAADDAEEESCGPGDTDADGDGYTPNQGDCLDSGSISAVDAYGNDMGVIYAADVHPGATDDCETVNVDEDCASFGTGEGWGTSDGLWSSGATWDHTGGNDSCGSEVTCVEISDDPLNTAIDPAAPTIMFVLDDSGSMDWEFLCDGTNQGKFDDGNSYLFISAFTEAERKQWKSQWSEYNHMYYDPTVTYTPWPRWHYDSINDERYGNDGTDLLDGDVDDDGYLHADPDTPRSDPMDKDSTLEMGDVYLEFEAEEDITKLQRIVVERRNHNQNYSSTVADAVGLDLTNTKDPGHQGTDHDASGFFEGNKCAWNYPEWWDGESHDGNVCSTYAPDLIFDDGDDIFSSENWSVSGTDDWEWNGGAVYTSNTNNNRDEATWLLNIPESNDYYVYAWADDYSGRDRAARYTIYYDHDDNPNTNPQSVYYDFDQYTYAKHWHILDKSNSIHFNEQTIQHYTINNSHYFIWNDTDGDLIQDSDEIYLVNISGSVSDGTVDRQYYHVDDADEDGKLDMDELTLLDISVTDSSDEQYVPEGVKATSSDGTLMSAEEERQNFANWYSFYRKRLWTAKAAVGQTIEDMYNVNVGLYGINQSIIKPMAPVDLTYSDGSTVDETETLLKLLYNGYTTGSTPLRMGLGTVGEYFSTNLLADRYYTCDQDGDGGYDICTGNAYEKIGPWQEDDSGGSCQKAFAILMTDGYWNQSVDNSVQYADHDTSKTDTDYDGGIFADAGSHTREISLADVAMYFYEHDLNTNLDDEVVAKGYDIAPHQHMTTYSVAFGVSGSIDSRNFPDCLPDGDYDEDTPETAYRDGTYDYSTDNSINQLLDGLTIWVDDSGSVLTPSWIDEDGDATEYPVYYGYCPEWQGDDDKVDDLFHAAVNGRGKFLNASNPQELVEAMSEIRKLVKNSIQTGTAATVDDIVLTEDTRLYQAVYQKKQWAGNVFAYCLDDNGFTTACDGTADGSIIYWNADSIADNFGDTWWDSGRQVLTLNDDTREIVPFRFSELSAAQQDSLVSEDIVNYLRGDRSLESENGGTLRDRLTYFGDIVDSQIVHYSSLIFVGANDGGLHVFDSDTGEELMTYIPALVYRDYIDGTSPYWNDKLYKFSQESHEENHKFFVNNTVDIQYVSDTAAYVLGGLRKGGRGIYALNIRGITQGIESYADSGDVTGWEYPVAKYDGVDNDGDSVIDEADEEYDSSSAETHTDPFMGYTFSLMKTTKVRTGEDATTWAVIFGNGYDSYNQLAALYVVDLQTGQLIRRIVVDAPERPDTTTECNGLSTPAILDEDLDEVADYAYAGDLLGNMWKFDLTDDDPDNWHVYFEDSSGTGQPLFRAKNRQGYRQPITMEPIIMDSCQYGSKGEMIIFGTGRFIGSDDSADVSTQTLYGLWDWSKEWESIYEEEGYSNADDLARQTYLGSFSKVLDSSTAAECEASCTTECEDSSALMCSTYYADCIEYCSTDETDCNSECEGTETTCIATCLSDYDSCYDGCAGDATCQDTCLITQSTCNTACSDDRTNCESNCTSGETACEDECDSDLSSCENDVVDGYCRDAVTSTDSGSCTETCSNTYTACLVQAGSDSDLLESCAREYQICKAACNSYWDCTASCGQQERSLSNLENIPHYGATNKTKYISLLEQKQLWYGGINYSYDDDGNLVTEQVYGATDPNAWDAYIRVISDYEPEWFDFDEWSENNGIYPSQNTHVGWYFDLPIDGERQVSSFILRSGVIIGSSIIPSSEPCQAGGYSMTTTFDACSGGALETTYIDINGDGVIDENDMINIGTDANPNYVSVTSTLNSGILSTPTVIDSDDGSVILNPDYTEESDNADVEISGVPTEGSSSEDSGVGMYFWREVE